RRSWPGVDHPPRPPPRPPPSGAETASCSSACWASRRARRRSSNSWSWRPVRTPPGPFGAEVLGVLPHPFEGVDGGGERPLELAQDPCTPCEDRAHRAQGIGVRAPESAHPPPVPLLLARPG